MSIQLQILGEKETKLIRKKTTNMNCNRDESLLSHDNGTQWYYGFI